MSLCVAKFHLAATHNDPVICEGWGIFGVVSEIDTWFDPTHPSTFGPARFPPSHE